jgi:hypothetical protein
MALANTAVAASNTDIYTSSGETCVVTMYFCNYSGVTRTLTLYAVPSGESADNTSIIVKDVEIIAADTYTLSTDRLILANGDKITAIADAGSAITATVSYASV